MSAPTWPPRPGEVRALLKRKRLNRDPHVLYRCYDADDRLLYIGCTSDIKARMRQHAYSPKATSVALRELMVRYETSEPIAGWTAAHQVEIAAIQAEAPLLNVMHNERRLDGAA